MPLPSHRPTRPSDTDLHRSVRTLGPQILRRSSWSLSLACALLVAACGGTEPTVTTNVSVTPPTATLTTQGATVALSASARDQNGDPMPDATFTWSSGAPSVASVDGDGVVTAVGNGTATVSATTDGVSGSASVTVDFPVVTTVEVAPDSVLVTELGGTTQLAATVRDQNGEAMDGVDVTWASSDESVVSVDGDGVVTAAANGMASVTAMAEGVSGDAMVLVASSLAYVSHRPVNTGDNTDPVYVVKVATGEVLDSVEVGSPAGEVAILPDGSRAYVPGFPTQPGDAWVIETATNTVSGTVPVGGTPIYSAAAPDGEHVYVGNVGDQTVSVIATATDTEVATVAVGGLPRGLAVTPDGSSVYVSLGDDCPGTVDVISAETNTVVGSIALEECAGAGISISPDGAFAYVPDGRFTSVTVIDTGNDSVETVIGGFSAPDQVAFSPDGEVAYVTSYTTGGDLIVVDAASHTITGTIDLGSDRVPKAVATSPDGAFVYVTSPETDEVIVVSSLTRSVVMAVPVGSSPFHVAITPF